MRRRARKRYRRQDRRVIDSDDNIVVSSDPEHLISTIGVSDMIIVHTKDATMICPKREAQRVKELVGKVKEKVRDEVRLRRIAFSRAGLARRFSTPVPRTRARPAG